MRHRKRGRTLGRSSSHRRALLRNLASSLFLTERAAELVENPAKVKGRIITTLQKAKEVRPLVEKCITIARGSLPHQEAAERYATEAERDSEAWRQWRQSARWRQWCNARAPSVAARRRALQLLGNKEAVRILFDDIAPRFADRNGGYTRILKLAAPRLGDAGRRAILELVGVHDRVLQRSEKPAFSQAEDEPLEEETGPAGSPQEEAGQEHEGAEPAAAAEQPGAEQDQAPQA